ncbi:MAG: PBP1A family penicillin-binding protein [Candidatus Hydrogenedentes bacterium]|nr:PBP1A family penicillin-binding protein [Candidatus Hydrogenedentota bacterium]
MSDDAEQTDVERDAPRARVRGCAPVLFIMALVVAAAWGACLGVFVWILEDAEETLKALDDFRPKIGSKVYSFDAEQLAEFTIEARQLISLNEMPLILQKAFIATEDDTFYGHKGVRPLAVVSAAVDALRTGNMRGASTITQQIVRNIEKTGITKEVTISRKLREMVVSLQMEREFTKDEILEMYLNQIFLGVSAYGVEAACQQYFMKSASELTLGECAMLAGLTRSPNRNNPFRSPENARARRDIVLRQMYVNGLITEAEREAAVAESVDDSVVTREERAALLAESGVRTGSKQFLAPYFVEEVRQFMSHPPAPYEVNARPDELFEGGLEIHTTLDMRLQQAAETILHKALDVFDADKLEALEKEGKADEFVPVSGALICLDVRPGYEGFIRAMVGGRDFETKKFNMATQALRQPGSSVKPFVWLTAIDNGMTPSDIIVDEEFIQIDYMGNLWQPKNFGNKFRGPVSLRHGLENSINIVSIKLVDRFKMPLVRSYLRSAGFKQPISDAVGLTIGLGTSVTTVLDQAECYSTLALGGIHVDPIMITEVRDRDGLIRFDYRTFQKKERVFEEDAVYSVVHLMEGVCQPDIARSYYPSGHRTAALKRPRAGKTGTTNESWDAWFCGFTPAFVCVVWIGYEDNRPLGDKFTGGRLASPIWTDFMIVAHEGVPVREFRIPAGVEFYNVNRKTGLAGGDFREAFIRGAEPPTQLPVFDLPEELELLLEGPSDAVQYLAP